MAEEFSLNDRNDILARYFKLQAEYRDTIKAFEDESKAIPEGFKAMEEETLKLSDKYREGVPVVALSRCPFTGNELKHSLDYFGIDGLWWSSDYPVRPDENLPVSYFGFTGALKLGSDGSNNGNDLETFPFTCTPGPDVPFVLPRLLYFNQIKAVLSSYKIGSHTAYLVFYYSYPPMTGLERPNEFGMGSYRYFDLNGDIKYGHYYDAIRDFELEEWIRDGKLLWIQPDDKSLRLNSDVSRCPYLGLEGSRVNKYLSGGKIWYDTEAVTKPGMEAQAEITAGMIEQAEKFVEERGGVI